MSLMRKILMTLHAAFLQQEKGHGCLYIQDVLVLMINVP